MTCQSSLKSSSLLGAAAPLVPRPKMITSAVAMATPDRSLQPAAMDRRDLLISILATSAALAVARPSIAEEFNAADASVTASAAAVANQVCALL